VAASTWSGIVLTATGSGVVVSAFAVIVVQTLFSIIAASAGAAFGPAAPLRGDQLGPASGHCTWAAARLRGVRGLPLRTGGAVAILKRKACADRARDEDPCRGRLDCDAGASPRDGRAAESGGRCPGRRSNPAGKHQLQQRQRHQQAGAVAKRPPGAIDRLSRRATRDPQSGGDLIVAETLELAHHDGGALWLRQCPQALHKIRELGPAGGFIEGADRGVTILEQLLRGRRLVAQVVQRGVADNPEQPRPQLDLGLGVAQGEERLRECVLGHVLGAMPRDDRGGIAAERFRVAPHDLLECGLVPGPDEGDQAAVGLRTQCGAEKDPRSETLRRWGRGQAGVLFWGLLI
jgi:hypothetical protein